MDLGLILAALKVVLTTADAEEARTQIEALVAEIESLDTGSTEEVETPEAVETEADKDAVQAESDMPSEEEEEKPVVANRSKASSKALTTEAVKLAQRVATLEEEVLTAKRRERIAASRDRIPDSLVSFAEKLDLKQLEQFIAGLPEPKTTGIRASSKPTMGDKAASVEGTLSDADSEALARAFGNKATRTQSIMKEGHRVVASHIFKGAK